MAKKESNHITSCTISWENCSSRNRDGDIGEEGERFLDNQRIEGTISEMLDECRKYGK